MLFFIELHNHFGFVYQSAESSFQIYNKSSLLLGGIGNLSIFLFLEWVYLEVAIDIGPEENLLVIEKLNGLIIELNTRSFVAAD